MYILTLNALIYGTFTRVMVAHMYDGNLDPPDLL